MPETEMSHTIRKLPATFLLGWRFTLPFYFLSLVMTLRAQQPDTLLATFLDSVTVTATRLEGREGEQPFSLSLLSREQIQAGQQQLSLDEALAGVPGLFTMGADNFSQDIRLSLRGFGARAAFGIRGIKILVDGLPESTPDGQGQADNIDVGLMERAEVIRGPASGLYGNAAGGAISFTTEDPPAVPFAEARLSAGSFGFQRYQLKGGLQQGRLGFLAYGSHTRTDGYREQSRMEASLFNGKLGYQYNMKGRLQLLINLMDSPLAEDAGALSREGLAENRRQAWASNLTFDAGEAIRQARVGLRWEHKLEEHHQLEARLFYLSRDLENRLPFESGGAVQLGRQFFGGGASYRFLGKIGQLPYRFRLGLDIEQQQDNRQRFDNLAGQLGDRSLYQEELFRSFGLFCVQELQLTHRLKTLLSTRYDAVELEARDRFLIDGDDSGQRGYDNFSFSLGMLFALSQKLRLNANVSTSFETPALSELSAAPTGGGFNPMLSPQRATNYEIGAGGRLGHRLRGQLSAFFIALQDELVPFELESFPGRAFYRNAGRSSRRGVEASLYYQAAPGLSAMLAYTWSDFTYQTYRVPAGDFRGNRLPGIPEHFGYAGVRYLHRSGFGGSLRCQYTGALYADDANTEQAEGYLNLGLRLHYSHQWGHWGLYPFLGADNLLNASYNSNVRINAFGGRYYEPAPGIHGYAGVKVAWLAL